MTARRDEIWITGIGCATSLGLDFATLADNVIAGRSGVGPISGFDAGQHTSRIAAALPKVPCPSDFAPSQFATLDPCLQMMLWCAATALRDAGLSDERRIGLAIGIGAEDLQRWERDALAGGDAIRHPESDSPGLAAALRSILQISGPFTTVAAACASGNVAFGVARQWIEMGLVDIVLAGGADLAVSPMSVASFGNLGALSKRNDEPARASRPFDRDRDGFVIGEGGALVVLESARRARKRAARPYGRLLGYAARSDAFHLVMPSADPTHAAAAVSAALRDARLNPDDVDYINAHATSTPAGDTFETKALHLAFGPAIEKTPVSGTKSTTGHLLSAASAVEAVIALAAIERNTLPPTINLDNVDPECPLCHVANHAQERKVDVVLSNSFGFGGCNTALLLGRVA
jgi:3-oxoacyl-[acyl-carrier-protein] synthase II